MFFGALPPREAIGGVLAHRVAAGGTGFPKGHVVDAASAAALEAAGVDRVTVARLEPGDLSEDEAAARLAAALAGPGLRVEPAATGRANLFAEAPGLVRLDAARIDALHARDEAITLATLPANRRVRAGEMVATVKIVPFGVAERRVAEGCRALAGAVPALAVQPFRPCRIAMVSTELPGLKASVLDKTRVVTEARAVALGATLLPEIRVPHAEAALAGALAGLDPERFDCLLIFGAAAITDRRDLVPAAIEAVGGRIERLGLPVDPGNLLLLAEWQGKPVIGAPGCARSPRENGFDWVLERLVAGVPVASADLAGMGVGGLLMEIVSRPQPRVAIAGGGALAAIVLAAGSSRRFGVENKLAAPLDGQPMLARVRDLVRAAGISPVRLVLGHEADAMAAIWGNFAEGEAAVANPEYAQGMATSLRAGLAALPESMGGALILLADMPRVKPATLAALAKAAGRDAEAIAFVPTFNGRWGNPVLVRRALFPALMGQGGDRGARALLEAERARVGEVPVDDPGILADFDTVEALSAASGDPVGGPAA